MAEYSVFLNSNINYVDWHYKQITKNAITIAVDGGVAWFEEFKIEPCVLLGDMDSVSPLLLNKYINSANTKVIIDANPNINDFAKSLAYIEHQSMHILNNPPDVIDVYGALDGRFDQVLANIFSCINYKYKDKVKFKSSNQVVRVVDKSCSINGKIGDIVGILPLQPLDFLLTSGLKYPVHALPAPISLGWLGSSNIMQNSIATINLSGGNVIIVHAIN